MAIHQIRFVNRTEGRAPVAGQEIVGGDVLVIGAGSQVKKYDDATYAAQPYGLAIESNIMLPISGTPFTVGEGYDYTDFNRGGLISCFVNGGEFELYDDGRGAPYVAGDTYVVNASVYVNDAGKITAVETGGKPKVGSVVEVEGTPVTRLKIKVII